ncbi:MAG: hypothetical protein NTZ35_07315 [Ignavibacteriales bacterium]|nr:hypothetical protein [Ignavibacteriales bacterium]
MKSKVIIVLQVVLAITLTTECVNAQQTASAVCAVQATVIPAVTLRTAVNPGSSPSNSLVPRTGVLLSGEGVIRLKVESAEKAHEITIDLQRESKELKEKTFSRINRIKIEYMSS